MNGGTIQLQIGGALELILRPPPQGHVNITARYGAFEAIGRDRMAYTLPAGMEVSMQVAYVDQFGNPATIDGLVAWASSDTSVATATVDAGDSTICVVAAIGETGTAQITATADADLGSGTRTLVTLLDITAVAGEAVAGTISPMGDAVPIG